MFNIRRQVVQAEIGVLGVVGFVWEKAWTIFLNKIICLNGFQCICYSQKALLN